MKIVFYVSPFSSQGDPFFFSGALTKKVVPQAEALRKAGHDVRLVIGELLERHDEARLGDLPRDVLPAAACGMLQRSLPGDAHKALYADPSLALPLAEVLQAHTSDVPDVAVVWEAPADALRLAFPGTLVLSQMPGAVSRVPYPETTTVDPAGLFRRGLLTTEAREVLSYVPTSAERDLAERFLSQQRASLLSLSPFSRASLDPNQNYEALVLVPLQVSSHYAFEQDTGLHSQIDFLLRVLAEAPPTVGVVATQYVAGRIADTPLSAEVVANLRRVHPNLIWNPEFDKIDGISQYLLPHVDAVCSLSSSIGLQAKMLGKPLVVPVSGTHIAPLADATSIAEGLGVPPSTLDGVPVTAFLLGRYQPATVPLLKDTAFADCLISAFVERSKAEGLDRLPRLCDIVPSYAEALLGLAKPDVAAQRLGAMIVGGQDPRAVKMLEFSRAVASPEISAISFDIFDTLVDRPLEQPTHVFRLIEPEVETLSDGKIRNFELARIAAEQAVRSATEQLEITLAEIHDELARRHDLLPSERDAVMGAEVEAELRMLRARPHGRRLYELARATGKPILIVSDMYLPQPVIEDVLRRTGYQRYDSLFLSSTYGCRKHDGGLFQAVLAAYPSLRPDSILHVGDNPDGDVKKAREAGFRVWHIPRSTVSMMRNKRYSDLLQSSRRERTLGESAVVGAIARRTFDDPFAPFKGDTLFNADAFTLGYAGAGPMFVAMAQWIREEAKRDGRTDLYFLARDGKVLKDVFDTLSRACPNAPRTHYIYASRRAARVASLRCRADILSIVEGPLAATTAEAFLAERLGIRTDTLDSARLTGCGIQWPGQVLNPKDGRDAFRRIALEFEAEILTNAATERQAYQAYLERYGLTSDSHRAAVVDIGYGATMQAAIASMLGLKDLAGYYFVTFDSARRVAMSGLTVRGFAGDFVERRTHGHPICRNGFLFETLFCASDGTFVKFADAGGRQPVLLSGPADGIRRTVIDAVHSGSLALARDLAAAFGSDVDRLTLDPYLCCRLLNEWIERPAGRDAEIMEGIPFEDSFGGAQARFLIPPRRIGLRDERARTKAIWQQGTSVFFRRPDIAGNEKPPAKPPSSKVTATKSAVVPSPAIMPPSPSGVPLVLAPALLRIESWLLKRIGDRKQLKYRRNRAAFFADSASPLMRLYGRLTGDARAQEIRGTT